MLIPSKKVMEVLPNIPWNLGCKN